MSSVLASDAFGRSSPGCSPGSPMPLWRNDIRAHQQDEEELVDGDVAIDRPPPTPRCCPLSARCVLRIHDDIIQHLRQVHGAQECDVGLGEEKGSVGIVDADTPIFCESKSKPRRSCLILRCDGEAFLWTLESKVRADSEIQIAVAVRLIDQQGGANYAQRKKQRMKAKRVNTTNKHTGAASQLDLGALGGWQEWPAPQVSTPSSTASTETTTKESNSLRFSFKGQDDDDDDEHQKKHQHHHHHHQHHKKGTNDGGKNNNNNDRPSLDFSLSALQRASSSSSSSEDDFITTPVSAIPLSPTSPFAAVFASRLQLQQQRKKELAGKKYHIRIVAMNRDSTGSELSWTGSLDTREQNSWLGRQDQLVSSGKALVVLYPTHKDMFKLQDGEAFNSPNKLLLVRTEIRKFEEGE